MADDFELERLRAAIAQRRIHWHRHTLERLFERGISRTEVIEAMMQGEVIEVYADDRPYPSVLILRSGPFPLHVVAALDPVAYVCHVVTAYRPDADHFEADFRRRRRP